MTDYKRVRDNATGHHLSVPAEAVAANPGVYTVLKQAAVAPSGAPLPPTYKTPGKTPAAPADDDTEKSGHKADSKKGS